MPTNIAVITQNEFEPKLLPKANPTMAIPFLDPLFVPKLPKKKFLQIKLWAKHDDAPAPEPHFIQVLGHNRSFSILKATNTTPLLPNPKALRKNTRSSNQKRRLNKRNILAFPKPKMTARRLFNWHTPCT
jgi:hypothetical protein